MNLSSPRSVRATAGKVIVNVDTTTVAVGDLEFTVRVGGPENGPVVLLLHGFPSSGTCFDEIVPRLHESGLRTVVPDQRGYSPGARPPNVEDYRIEHLVSDAVGILGADAAFIEAENAGRIDAVEDELFVFGRALAASPQLQMALSDPASTDEVKLAIVGQLLSDSQP